MAGMWQIRHNRGVPAKRGMRVIYRGGDSPKGGRIMSARGGYLKILLDGDKHTRSYHPTWKLDYLDEFGRVIFKSRD